jgi:hypothetical protein
VKKLKFWAKVIVSVLIFSVSFLAFDRMLFTIVRQSASHYYASMRKDTFKYRSSFGKGDGELLIFGSSRAMTALSSSILSAQLNKRVINEAEEGKFPRYFHCFYQKYRKSFPKPKVVLYGVDYFIFGLKSYPAQLARLGMGIKVDAIDLARAVNNKSSLLSRISWLYRKKPDIDNYLVDLLRLERQSGNENEADKSLTKGQGPRQTAGSDNFQGRLDKPVKPDSWPTLKYRPFPGVEGAYLESLLTELEHEDVPVILIFIPDYVGANETNFQQNKFKSNIRALAARHRRVFILDFNRPERFDLNNPALFRQHSWGTYNCHLSPEGRMIFTGLLAPVVKNVLRKARKAELAEEKRAR